MGDGENPHMPPAHCLLAGLETGVVAAVMLIGWLALASAWYRRSIWSTANIMATNFYGEAALGRGFTFRSLAGLALYLVLYGIIGALFGLAVQTHPAGVRLSAIGVLVGIGWYYLSFHVLWRTVNPLLTLYTHNAPMVAGHVLYGGLLGRFPGYLRALAVQPSPALPDAG
jgi:prepilin signal peptidase PulO-like enzyme (type II secretory pathway)